MAVYDDQNTSLKTGADDDELRRITGINPADEKAMEARAADQATDTSSDEQKALNKHVDNDSEKRSEQKNNQDQSPDIPYNEETKKKRGWLRRHKKKVAVGGGALGGGVGISALLISLIPLGQPIHLAQTLSKGGDAHSSSINHRIATHSQMARFSRSNNFGELRVGVIGSRVYGGMMTRLAEKGITFGGETASGRHRFMNISENTYGGFVRNDPEATYRNLMRDFPELSETIMNADDVPMTTGPDGRIITIDLGEGSNGLSRGARASVMRSIVELDINNRYGSGFRGKVVSAVRLRTALKYNNLPSLFHPMRGVGDNLTERIDERVNTFNQNRKARRQAQGKAVRESGVLRQKISTKTQPMRNFLSSRAGSLFRGALTFTGEVCTVRELAKIIPGAYYATTVLPSTIRVLEAMGMGDQAKGSGGKVNMQELGDFVSEFSDPLGGTIWQAKALNALANDTGGAGVDIEEDARIAFTTRGSSARALAKVFGMSGGVVTGFIDSWAGAAACSKAGLFVQAAVSIGAIVVQGLACPVTAPAAGGTCSSLAGQVARMGGQMLRSYAIRSLALRWISGTIEDRIEGKVADACGIEVTEEGDGIQGYEVLDAKKAGNCLAFGARTLHNTNAASMGGVEVSGTEERTVMNRVKAERAAEFAKLPLTERLFSWTDSRSLLATTIMRPIFASGGFRQVLSSTASEVFRIPLSGLSQLLSLSSLGITKAYAQPASSCAELESALSDSPITDDDGNEIPLSSFDVGSSCETYQSSIAQPNHGNDTYDWGTPLVTIPTQLLEDERYDDALENAQRVRNLISPSDDCEGCETPDNVLGASSYHSKALKCFGVNIGMHGGMFKALPQQEVDMIGDDYNDAGCNDLSDINWRDIIMFVFDDSIIGAIACVEGFDDASCIENGISGQISGALAGALALGGHILQSIRADTVADRCTGGLTIGARELSDYAKERWNPTSSGGYSCRNKSTDSSALSIHAEGRAIDQHFDYSNPIELQRANELFGWLLANAESLGVQYVKYWKLQWSPSKGLNCVTSAADIANHSNHIHYEITRDAAAKQTPWFGSRTDNTPFAISQDLCG